jgi:hypothetical protein
VFDPEAADFHPIKREGVWNGKGSGTELVTAHLCINRCFHNSELKFPPMTLHDTACPWKNYQEHDINFSVFLYFARAKSYD